MWHKGIIYKSKYYPINCSVPQGACISPLLFLVYINDIPLADSYPISFSSLFADDLASFFIFTKPSVSIFSKSGNKNGRITKKIKLDLKLGNDLIPYNTNPLFLGITFDEHLCFNKHIDGLKSRALSRLNILKIISHSSWHLNLKTLKNIYNALISSIFTYSFFIVANASRTNLEKLQIIQNQGVKCIFKLPSKFPTLLLYPVSNIPCIKNNLIRLGCRRITKSLAHNSNTIELVLDYLMSISSIRRNSGIHTPLCCFLPIVAMALLHLGLTFEDPNLD